jgi:hypothetical protein
MEFLDAQIDVLHLSASVTGGLVAKLNLTL